MDQHLSVEQNYYEFILIEEMRKNLCKGTTLLKFTK
uniref:Uncharacterized protein n=1 Tax=Siphoviridae sp. ctk5O4 TaxID=2827921 RepID=A0A8S5SJR4_9CAUD|nr:MAG TPA: hypothetical protein [Siphoviridae sp. ctk5O4]